MNITARRLLTSMSAIVFIETVGVSSLLAQPARSDLPTAPHPAPNPSGSSSATESVPGPGDIIVTANRRAENLQRVAVAVTAVSELQLRSGNLLDTKDLVRLAPTLGYTEAVGPRSSSFYIRGVGTFSTVEAADNSVVDIGLVMLVVVIFERLARHVGRERIVGIGQVGQCKRHQVILKIHK